MGERLPITVYAEVVGRAQSPTWLKTLVYGFPESQRWPNTGYLSMPESLSEDLLRLLSSDEYRWQNELTVYQWEILGPIAAVENLESFCLEADSSELDWDGMAAAHVYSVLRAHSWSTVPEGDDIHLETA